jgi:GNAT superfamily N-acetyltransferase
VRKRPQPPLDNPRIQPLTPDLWPTFEDLFADGRDTKRCWCMYWRIGGGYGKRLPEANRGDFHQIVREGPPPGLLAFEGDLAVGWCQVTPKRALPSLERRKFLETAVQPDAWCISCFFVRKGYRRRGVTAALIQEAVRFARDAGADSLEAYPLDPIRNPVVSFTGYLRTFLRLGFQAISAPDASRPVLRYWLGS